MLESTPQVLSIQSHVVHGYVGNKSAVFPLQVLGFEVDFINTVQFSTHTKYSHIIGTVLKNEEMEQLIEGLVLNEVDYYTHLITGYSRSPDSLKQISEIIRKLRQKNPNLIYGTSSLHRDSVHRVCDPVMGDNGQMYVPEEILPAYRDNVIPLADILTPNQFEAELLTGLKMTNLEEALIITQALHKNGIKTVVISSSELGDENNMIGIASTATECYKIEIPKVKASFTGTGDLFAALFLAWHHKTNSDIKLSLENTIATLQTIVQDTYKKSREELKPGEIPPALIELKLIQNKAAIENPASTIKAVKIK